MPSTLLARPRHSDNAARKKALSRIRDARVALTEPAHVIAERARARYQTSPQPARLPSKKPRLVTTRRKDRSFVWVMRLFCLGIVVSLFAVVGIQTTIAQRQIDIDSIRAQQKVEINRYQGLRHDVADLKSPERITRRAQYLGLVQPSRFVSISIPMPVGSRSDVQDEKQWTQVKAIVDATS